MDQLFQKTTISNMELRNHFVRSATAMGTADNGEVTEELVKTFSDLAEGGVGLIITGMSHVSKKGQSMAPLVGVDEESRMPGLQKLVAVAHKHGAKIMVQLVHAGAKRFYDSGFPAEGPSAVKDRTSQIEPMAMTLEDINKTVNDFASAAKLAKKSGFDAIQIHGAHEYLLSAFLSPYTNQRSDDYGGAIENRARIVFEVYRAVRIAVGQDYPITIKINVKDVYDIGLNWEDSAWICQELSDMGIDAIELSISGGPEFLEMFLNITSTEKEAYLKSYAREIKSRIQCPLILVGGIRSLEVINELFDEGSVDFFSMSRPLISEPNLIARWQSNDRRKARCISCSKCIFSLLQGGIAKCYEFENKE
jgi:2,4-dienoyl-CoA reductase-like NADH-dependent reductase (Old Yellow Enzyme family)